jgi:F0F1-type ATP synthase delta subunit
MNHITITSAVALSPEQIKTIKTALQVTDTDVFTTTVDPENIAGLKVQYNGKILDLTTKHQLAKITHES